MTVNRTTLLDLPLPVTGTESGVWGDVTNNGLTQYLDIAIAGRNALTSSDFSAGALTISLTEGDSSATNIAAGSAQYATLYVSSLAQNSTITAPSSNRAYRVVNADATYTLTVKAAGQTGVVFPVNTSGTVVFNGTDYVLLGSYVIASAGTASLPSITFTGDTNTGIFSPAADTIAFAEGGVEAMRVDSSGNVGIGTTSPGTKLHVNQTNDALPALQLQHNDGDFILMEVSDGTDIFKFTRVAATNDLQINVITSANLRFATNNTERVRIDSSGNVGIGVTPSAWGTYKALEIGTVGNNVYGGASSNSEVGMLSGAYYNSGWKYAVTGVNPCRFSMNDVVLGQMEWYTAASGTAGNAITFTQAMTLDTSGNLFLGDTSASMGTPRLFVKGSRATDGVANFQNTTNTGDVNHGTINIINSATGATGNDARVMFSFRQVGATTGLDPMASMGAVKEAGDMAAALQFNTRSASGSYSEKVRIDSSGNFMVGVSTAEARFTVGGDIAGAASTTICRIGTADYTTNTVLSVAPGVVNFDAAGTVGGRFHISSGGEVRIAGTTDQGAYNLQVQGTGVWGAGAYVNGSDSRIKEDIAPIATGLSVVEKLNPVTYRYKEDWSKDQSTQTGFIAQELLVALQDTNYVDSVVQQGGEKGYYSVAYQNIIPILTKAIQEQQALITQLTARITALEGA